MHTKHDSNISHATDSIARFSGSADVVRRMLRLGLYEDDARRQEHDVIYSRGYDSTEDYTNVAQTPLCKECRVEPLKIQSVKRGRDQVRSYI